MGIAEVLKAPQSPCQNGYAERLIDKKGVPQPLYYLERSGLEEAAGCIFPPLPPIPHTPGAQQTMPD
jgi:hypothetical protein